VRRQSTSERHSNQPAREQAPFNVPVVAVALLLAIVFVVWAVLAPSNRPDRAPNASQAPSKQPPAHGPKHRSGHPAQGAVPTAPTAPSAPASRTKPVSHITKSNPALRTIPASIAKDCSKDVTSALARWIASVPNGSILSFAPQGCYRIDRSLRIEGRWGLTFEGNGATFKAGTEGDLNRRHLWFVGGGNLRIRNVTVRGAHPSAGANAHSYHPDREGQAAFEFAGVHGAVLENSRAYDVYGDFVLIWYDIRCPHPCPPSTFSQNITIRNNRFERNGRHGVTVLAARDITIDGNYFGEIGFDGIDVEADGPRQRVDNLVIRRNKFGPVWLLPLGFGGPAPVTGVSITDNTMNVKAGTPVLLVDAPQGSQWSGFRIERNTFLIGSSPRGGIEFRRTTDVVVRGNVLAMPPSPWGSDMAVVKLFDAHTVRVTDNLIKGDFDTILWADPPSSDYSESGNKKG